jgi:hypothetical protein
MVQIFDSAHRRGMINLGAGLEGVSPATTDPLDLREKHQYPIEKVGLWSGAQ